VVEIIRKTGKSDLQEQSGSETTENTETAEEMTGEEA